MLPLNSTHLMGELSAEDLKQVPDIPRGSVHVVVNLSFPDWRRLPVDHDLLDDEPHPGEALAARRILPNGLFVNFVDSE